MATLLTFFSLEASAYRQSTTNDIPVAPTNELTAQTPAPSAEQATVTESPAQDLALDWNEVKVKSGDSLARIFQRMELSTEELHKMMQQDNANHQLRQLQPGQTLKIATDTNNSIHTLLLEISRFDTLALQRDGDSYITSHHHRDTEKKINHTVAKIDSSLYEAGQASGLSDPLILELANIFGWDIDFALDIRSGDQFAIIYEEHFLDGERIEQGPILAAEFISQGNSYKAVRFTDADGNSDYYTPEGLSMRKAFLRTPVDFRRISSRFGTRKHPILNRMKMHKGVDYVAPSGTPIRAAGDGKIAFAGDNGGYGHSIVIQHGGTYSTLYAHMSRFKRDIKVGKRVRQGETIGYVGSSGLATGPHLHYEFRVNGIHRNPLTVKLPNAEPLPKQYQIAFGQYTTQMLGQLEQVKQQTRVAALQPKP